jgi:hypothetical protein
LIIASIVIYAVIICGMVYQLYNYYYNEITLNTVMNRCWLVFSLSWFGIAVLCFYLGIDDTCDSDGDTSDENIPNVTTTSQNIENNENQEPMCYLAGISAGLYCSKSDMDKNHCRDSDNNVITYECQPTPSTTS